MNIPFIIEWDGVLVVFHFYLNNIREDKILTLEVEIIDFYQPPSHAIG